MILITVVLGLIVSKQGKDFSALLSLITVALVVIGSMAYMKPIIIFISKLTSIGKLNKEFVDTLLKAVGIGLLSELVCLVCSDSGQNALAKTAQVVSGAVILWLSLPIFTKLIELLENVLGAI